MVARTLWLWLSFGWLMSGWLTEALVYPGPNTLCDPGGPCRCVNGKVTCDCFTSFLKEVVLSQQTCRDVTTSSISVANCFHLHVATNAVSQLGGLQQVSVANVRQVTLEERAFNWTTGHSHHSGLLVNISNCSVQQVPSYSFQGYIRNVLLSSVNISKIDTYAFNSLDRGVKIEFDRVNVKEVMTQSFKKISVEFLIVLGSDLSSLTERTMQDVTVHSEMRFEKVKMNRLEKSALRINSPRDFRLIKCAIGHIESNALQVSTKGDISIHDNVFSHVESHAFAGITVEDRYLREAGKQDFVFVNNTMIEFAEESLKLNTTSFDPRLDWIMLKQKCSCDSTKSWMDTLVIFSSNGSAPRRPSVERLIYCLNPKPTSISDYRRLNCIASRFSVWTLAVVILAVVAALSAIGLVVYCGIRRRGKRYINVPTAASELRAPGDKPHMLVVPDGKTYRETELHVIFEHAEPIKTTNFVKSRPDGDAND